MRELSATENILGYSAKVASTSGGLQKITWKQQIYIHYTCFFVSNLDTEKGKLLFHFVYM